MPCYHCTTEALKYAQGGIDDDFIFERAKACNSSPNPKSPPPSGLSFPNSYSSESPQGTLRHFMALPTTVQRPLRCPAERPTIMRR